MSTNVIGNRLGWPVAIYLVMLHIWLVLYFAPKTYSKLEELLFESSELTPFYHEMVAYHMYADSSITEESTLFIGDSIVQGACVVCVVPNAVNLGIGRDTTKGVIERLRKYTSLHIVNAVVVAVGINDLARRNRIEQIDNYAHILNLIPKTTRVVIVGILPLDAKVAGKGNDINQRIKQLNDAIKLMCLDRVRCVYVDMTDLLIEGHKWGLSPEYHVGDGVHLNKDGYVIWISNIKQALG